MQRHASLAEELAEVCGMLKAVMSVLKTMGLSLSTIREYSRIMANAQSVGGGKRVTALCNMMTLLLIYMEKSDYNSIKSDC